MKKNISFRKNIFVGTTEISGHYISISKSLRKKGYNVIFFKKYDHPFGYEFDKESEIGIELPEPVMKAIYLIRRKKSNSLSIINRALWELISEITFFPIYIYSILKSEVFIFGFASSILSPFTYYLPSLLELELYILKKLKKKIIFNIGHGSEARPPYIDGSYLSQDGKLPSIGSIIKMTKRIRKRIKIIEKYADAIIAFPYTSHFLEKKFVNRFNIGLHPLIVEELEKISNEVRRQSRNPDKVRILHAPSHPVSKGTYKIREIINNMKRKGYKIEYVEITGKNNKEVLKEIINSDFVIDQIYSDSPLSRFGAEAGFFGKPAVVAGYGLKNLNRIIPKENLPVSVICHPDELEKIIEKLIVDSEYRKEIGQKTRDFLLNNWSADKIAEKYEKLIQGNIPENWLMDPKEISYIHGYGLPEEKLKSILKEIIEKYGAPALCLSHRPDLERKFLDFAGITKP